MDADFQQAHRYRHRAVEVRAIADASRDKASRRILYGIATDYDRMAASMDAIGNSELIRRARFATI
jgi:hypothetical protein